jgi:carbon monoxide dehydrogenase subunit G
MDISGEYTLHASRDRVWVALLDPDLLRRTLPGCELLEREEEDRYHVRLNVGVAGIRGVYSGTLQITEKQAPEHYHMAVDGSGAQGVLHGQGTLTLDARDASTTIVRYSGQAHLGGAIASVGMRMAGSAANMLIRSFFSRLADELASTTAPAALAGATASLSATTHTPAVENTAPGATVLVTAAPATSSGKDTSTTSPPALTGQVANLMRPQGALVRLIRRMGLSNGTVESEQRWTRIALGGLIGVGIVGVTALAAIVSRMTNR